MNATVRRVMGALTLTLALVFVPAAASPQTNSAAPQAVEAPQTESKAGSNRSWLRFMAGVPPLIILSLVLWFTISKRRKDRGGEA